MSKDGAELLNKVAEFYRKLGHYQDIEKVTEGNNSLDYKTFFSRPKLRFEYSDLNCWKDGKSDGMRIPTEEGTSIYVFDGVKCIAKRFCDDQIKEYDFEKSSLNMFFQRHFQLALLFPDIAIKRGIQHITNSEIIGQSEIEGKNCCVIQGCLIRDGDIEVSVDEESLLVKRVRLREWFRQMEERNIDDDVPNLRNLPFSKEINYGNILLDQPQVSLFEQL